jgi:lysophospholipase L1-like esterase
MTRTGAAAAQTEDGPLLVVLGDSFAEGHGDQTGEPSWKGWVPRTAGPLGIPRDRVRNLGRFGATTREVVDTQLAAAAAANAPLAGVAAGSNDLLRHYSRAGFERHFTRILATLAAADTVLFTFTFPDLPTRLPMPPAVRDVLRPRFEQANAFLQQVSADHGAICVDVRRIAGVDDPVSWSDDNLHPSAAGYSSLAGHLHVLLAEPFSRARAARLRIASDPSGTIGFGDRLFSVPILRGDDTRPLQLTTPRTQRSDGAAGELRT